MKNVKRLSAAVVLTLALGLSALGGEILTPPCATPEPGEILTPPCSTAPGDMNSEATSTAPSDLGTAKLANNGTSLGDIATDVVLNFLSLY
jgi:hypothetical protein